MPQFCTITGSRRDWNVYINVMPITCLNSAHKKGILLWFLHSNLPSGHLWLPRLCCLICHLLNALWIKKSSSLVKESGKTLSSFLEPNDILNQQNLLNSPELSPHSLKLRSYLFFFYCNLIFMTITMLIWIICFMKYSFFHLKTMVTRLSKYRFFSPR